MTYIKDCAEQLAPVLKFIYDKVSLFAMMPTQWKLAKIIPLHKKETKNNPENYRPISLLCSLGKVYEKVSSECHDNKIWRLTYHHHFSMASEKITVQPQLH
jgi:hypothetical protein